MTRRRRRAKEDAGIVPLGIPMLAGPGAITSVMVLVGQAQTRMADGGDPGGDRDYGGDLLAGAGELGPGGEGAGGYGDPDPGADYGAAAGGAGGAVFCEWDGGSGGSGQARPVTLSYPFWVIVHPIKQCYRGPWLCVHRIK